MLKIELTNTSAGLTAIQRAIAGDDITFTKLVIGDGAITDPDISSLTNVVNEIKYFPLGVVKPEDEEILRVRSNINNVGLTEDKVIREYGLFAKFGSEQEFLFAYLNSGESTRPLPKASGGRYDLNRDFVFYAGNSNNVAFDTNGDLVYATLNDIKAMDAKKENVFGKNSGFNLEKINLTENDSNKLFTAKGALDLLNDITRRISTAISDCKTVLRREMLNIKTELLVLINGNTNKLENLGDKVVENFGAGDDPSGIFIIQQTGAKIAGYKYFDTANKIAFKCIKNNSLTYADAEYFEAIDNVSLNNKLQNLFKIKTEVADNNGILNKTSDSSWSFAIVRLCDKGTGYFWSTHIANNSSENWFLRYTGGSTTGLLQRICLYINENPLELRYEGSLEKTIIYSVTYFYIK